MKRTIAAIAVLGTAVGLVGATAVPASAADIYVPPVVTTPPPPPPPPPVFNWHGPYAGLYGSFVGMAPSVWGTGGTLGFNWVVSPHFLVGIEASAGALFAAPTLFQGSVDGRLGFTFGAENRAMLYLEGGAGFIGGGVGGTWTAGGGLEFAVTDSLSLFAEAEALGAFAGGPVVLQAQFGFNWHFGN